MRCYTRSALFLLCVTLAHAAEYRTLHSNPHIPGNDLRATPGAVRSHDATEICGQRTPSLRHVTELQKREVFAAYHVPLSQRCKYEVDHLISLEIGGSNDTTNLWPQPYSAPGARQKDVLENKLHAMICTGQITPSKAQRLISHDWYSAYLLYVHKEDARLKR